MRKERALFSNCLEILYEKWKTHITTSLSISSLFYVVVPNDKVKNWLQLQMARDVKIGMGVTFCRLSELFSLFKKEAFPEELEIALLLQEIMIEKLNQKEELFAPLQKFFEGEELDAQKLVSLIQKLTRLFFFYGIHGTAFTTRWERFPKNWQEGLWKEVFVQKKKKYPARDLFSMEEILYEKKVELHLFGFSFLPLLYREMVHRLSEQYPVYHYLLSPTSCFWEDMTSDRERSSLLRFWEKKKISKERMEALEGYLKDQNSFLANLGKVGKENLKIIDREETVMEDFYLSKKGTSQLQILQEDLLSLNDSEIEEAPFNFEDTSIQIHQAPSPLREVEILYDFLFQEGKGTKISFSEVRVYAPDISLYEPYIHYVFGKGEIPYRIADLPLEQKSFFVRGVCDLFRLMEAGAAREPFFSLVQNPLLLARHPLDIETLQIWFTKTALFSNRDFEEAIDRIAMGFFSYEEKGEFPPSFFLEKSQAIIFDRFLFLYDQLKKDSQTWQEHSQFSLEDAADFFEKIASFYFAVSEEKREEMKALSGFYEHLQKMRRVALKFSQKKFLKETLFAELMQAMKLTCSYHDTLFDSVHFCSLIEHTILPSSFLCILGLNEEFPRNEKKDSLHLFFQEKVKEYVPTQNEKDRMLFLEAILSARKTLYLSYPISSGMQDSYSLLIHELLSYIEKRHHLEKNAMHEHIYYHPFFAFDDHSCKEKKEMISFSLSQSSCGRKKQAWEDIAFVSEEAKEIHSRTLEHLAFHPIQFFFHQRGKIFLEDRQKRSFLPSPFERNRIRSLFLKKEVSEVLALLEEKGILTSGIHKEVWKEEIRKELADYEKNLALLEVDKKEIFSVELIEGCEKPFRKEQDLWISPPIEVVFLQRTIQIIGRLDHLSLQGFLFHGRGTFWDFLRMWPRYLLFLQLPFIEKREILCTKNGMKKKIVVENPPSLLKLYLEYWDKSRKMPSPLIQEWSKPFLLQREEELLMAIEKTSQVSREEDPYLHRLFSLLEKPSLNFLKREWHALALRMFAPLIPLFETLSPKEETDEKI